MKEVRTVMEGEVTGGVVSLDFSKVGDRLIEQIGINAVVGESQLYGNYYVPNNSININVNGYNESSAIVIDEIYKHCVSIVDGTVGE